jgi:glycosyltransferase involved in cell wall biosynthesis
MNKGICAATGDVIGTLNSDDLFANDSVIETIARAFNNPQVEVVFGDLVYVDQKDSSRIVRYWKSSPFRSGTFSQGWVPPHPTFYVRSDVYRRYGMFDLSYRLAADLELMLRLLERHKVISHYIPEVLVRMRMGGATNKSLRNIIRGNIEIRDAFAKNLIPFPLMYLITKSLSRISQFFIRPTEYK